MTEPYPRSTSFKFLCEAHFQIYQEGLEPILGLDKPPHGSDFWRPSIIYEIIQQANLRINDERRRKQQLNTGQISQIERLREAYRGMMMGR
jgi:hypothetical protein